MVILFVVDATGRLFRKGKQVGREQPPQGWNEELWPEVGDGLTG